MNDIAKKYPLLRIFKYVAKTFFLNDFEFTLFAHIIDITNFNYHILLRAANDFPDCLNITEIVNFEEYKAIMLYLFIVSYFVKI